MKKNDKASNPYATNKGGRILSPKGVGAEPAAAKTVGDDLRAGRKRKEK